MLNTYKRFCQLIDDTRNVDNLYSYIHNNIVVPIDASDLLRWQWVQCVSALDKLVHDLVRIGMVQIYNGTRTSTAQYNSFALYMSTYQEMMNDPMNASLIFEQRIILCNGFKAFQEPTKIAEALAYIWEEKDKWLAIANYVGIDKSTCTTTLKNIVLRRNQIVHEGDYTDALLKRQDIFEQDVQDVRDFVLKLGEGIYNCVK